MLEGSRAVIPRLADCSSGRTEMEFSEPGLAASGCALAAVENANIAAKGMHQLSRLARISFMTGSLKGIQTGFKAAQLRTGRNEERLVPAIPLRPGAILVFLAHLAEVHRSCGKGLPARVPTFKGAGLGRYIDAIRRSRD